MSRFLFGVSFPLIFAAAEQLGQCAALSVDEELIELEGDDALEFSLLQTSLTVSQRLEPRHAQSLLSQVVEKAPLEWNNFSTSVNMSSPLALLSSWSSRTSARDIIAWPGACVLSLSFAVTLIFVVVLWTVMLEASHASKTLANRGHVRGAGMAGAPGMARTAADASSFAKGAEGLAADCGACCPPAVQEVRSGSVPNFGGPNPLGSLLRSRPAPTLCPSLSLMHGAAQFRIPMASMELLRAGFFPMQISGPSGKSLLHAWLPMCTRTPPGGSSQACSYPGHPGAERKQTEIGHLLQLTTTDKITRFPHASIGLLQAGAVEHRLDIFGPQNEKYGTLCRLTDKWLVHYHSEEGSEQLALTLHHVPAAMGFCAYGADGQQVATATRIHCPGETLHICTIPGGDAMLAILCIMAIVLSMETVVIRNPAAPRSAVPQHSLPPGYADASRSPSQSPPSQVQSLPTLPSLDVRTSQSLTRSMPSAASTARIVSPGAGQSEVRSVPTVLQPGPFYTNPNLPNFAARPSPRQ
ncbi:unnamed protein product [Cladocopium goreaui]|uniref:Beta-galactosidase n=1 Tax=Cladocopium goreaui TaxID=2562237 RepID=A0A9P1C3N8_9DINO|nr:unnamed protein product [Cladocopium goreaui]